MVCVPFWGVGLKSNHISVSYSHRISATIEHAIALACLAYRKPLSIEGYVTALLFAYLLSWHAGYLPIPKKLARKDEGTGWAAILLHNQWVMNILSSEIGHNCSLEKSNKQHWQQPVLFMDSYWFPPMLNSTTCNPFLVQKIDLLTRYCLRL